jgi:hypothetical protein
MDLNRQALEQGAAGIRLRREALGQMPQSITSDRGYKVVTDAKGNIVGTNAPVAPVSSAVGGFADQRAAFNRGEGTTAEKAALGPNIRSAALAELSRPAPKPMAATAPNAGAQMGPPLQGSAQMAATAPALSKGNPVTMAGPTTLGAAGNLTPPRNTFSPPTIISHIGYDNAPSDSLSPLNKGAEKGLPPLNRPASLPATPPPVSIPSPVSGMTINRPMPLNSGAPTPLAPPTSLNSGNKMTPTKDDITKQRASLASTKR